MFVYRGWVLELHMHCSNFVFFLSIINRNFFRLRSNDLKFLWKNGQARVSKSIGQVQVDIKVNLNDFETRGSNFLSISVIRKFIILYTEIGIWKNIWWHSQQVKCRLTKDGIVFYICKLWNVKITTWIYLTEQFPWIILQFHSWWKMYYKSGLFQRQMLGILWTGFGQWLLVLYNKRFGTKWTICTVYTKFPV